MRLSLLDPGLVHAAGHHLDLDVRVCRELRRLGHEVDIYCSAEADDQVKEALSGFGEVFKCFRAGPYVQVERIDRVAGGYFAFEQHSRVLAEDLRKVAASDLWLFPSIFAAQLNACALSGSGVAVSGCVHLPATSEFAQDDFFWRAAMISCKRRGIRLNLGVMEPELRIEYQRIAGGDLKIASFPIPYEGSPIDRPRDRLRKIGFFGQQRAVKGAALVGKLATTLVDRRFQVVIHDSANSFKPSTHPGVEILGYVDDMAAEVAKCDCVVLPYDPVRYQSRGSGVLWETLATGLPVVAPLGSAPGRWVEAIGGGTLFSDHDFASILRAIDELEAEFSKHAETAFMNSRAWARKNSTERFVGALLAQSAPHA